MNRLQTHLTIWMLLAASTTTVVAEPVEYTDAYCESIAKMGARFYSHAGAEGTSWWEKAKLEREIKTMLDKRSDLSLKNKSQFQDSLKTLLRMAFNSYESAEDRFDFKQPHRQLAYAERWKKNVFESCKGGFYPYRVESERLPDAKREGPAVKFTEDQKRIIESTLFVPPREPEYQPVDSLEMPTLPNR
jgi:hypothetical protein